MADKKLSLLHLTWGQRLLAKLREEDTPIEMLAVYRATAGNLVKAKRDSDYLQTLIDDACEVDGSEAQECLQDFFAQCTSYMNAITSSLPKITPEMVEMVRLMQAMKKAPDPEAQSPTS